MSVVSHSGCHYAKPGTRSSGASHSSSWPSIIVIIIWRVARYLDVASLTGDCASIYFRGSSCALPFCFCTFYTLGIVHRQGRLQQAYSCIMRRAIKLSLPGAHLHMVVCHKYSSLGLWWSTNGWQRSIERTNKLLWTLCAKTFILSDLKRKPWRSDGEGLFCAPTLCRLSTYHPMNNHP